MGKIKSKIQHVLKITRWFMTYFPKRNSKKFSRVILKNIRLSGNQIIFSGRLYTNDIAKSANLVVRKFRDEGIAETSQIELSSEHFLKRMLLLAIWPITKINCYQFSTITEIDWSKLPASIYVISVDFNMENAALFFKPDTSLTFHLADGQHTLHIFEEPVISSVRIELYKFGVNGFNEIVNHMVVGKAVAKNKWVISEYTNSARDNGIAFYNYLRNADYNISPVYVIEKDNPDLLVPDGKLIVEFGSIEHLKSCLEAKVAAFTHHRTYCYPHILHDINKELYDSVYTVFLQHGVTALKKMVKNHYRKSRCGYSAVVVCSDKERDIFLEHMKFPSDEILVTGFPRYDRLYDLMSNSSTENSVLVFPTWRRGLDKQDSSEVASSEYVKEWREALIKLRNSFDGEIILILHPIIQRHTHLFKEYVDRIAYATEFQEELVRSLCLITDYSSVCFDALYLRKPVIMFQFDRENYGFGNDAFIDIETELPGVFAETSSDLQKEIIALASSNWAFKNDYLRDLYFKWDDNKNSCRLAEVIIQNIN